MNCTNCGSDQTYVKQLVREGEIRKCVCCDHTYLREFDKPLPRSAVKMANGTADPERYRP